MRHASVGNSSSLQSSPSPDLNTSEDPGATPSDAVPASVASPAVELFNRFDNVGTPRPNTEGEVIETIATEQMAQPVLLLPDVTWQTDCEMESEQEYEGEEVLEKKRYGRQSRYRIK